MYEIEYIPQETFNGQIRRATVNESNMLSVRLVDLQEYVIYNISVKAYTSVGGGPYSNPQAPRTLEDGEFRV